MTAMSIVALMVFGLAGSADAQRRNERQVRDLVRSLNAQIDDFQFSLDNQLRGSASRNDDDVENVHESIRNLQTAVDDFQENMNNRRENREDVRAIITAAKDVDAFLAQNPQPGRINSNWQGVRTTINSLASNYGVTPDWSTRVSNYPGTTRDSIGNTYPPSRTTDPPVLTGSGLTGTYALDTARSENAADIVSNSGVAAAQRQDLQSKLEAPDQLAISIRGNEVTLASSKAPPVTFIADGQEKTEQAGGRTIRVRATMRGEALTITSLGGETDYTVTFASLDGGRTLKVSTRRPIRLPVSASTRDRTTAIRAMILTEVIALTIRTRRCHRVGPDSSSFRMELSSPVCSSRQ